MGVKKIITAAPDTLPVYLRKVWEYRALIVTFAKRDIKIKYAQTWLGLGWALLQPATAVIVYTLFFHFVVKVDTGNVSYVLFVLRGFTGWNLFSYLFSQGSASLLGNQDVLKKMSFPKIILPLSKVLTGLTEFMVSFALLSVIWAFSGVKAGFRILLLPMPVLGLIFFALAVTLVILSLSIRYRDILHIGPFLVYFGIWFTPVFYPVSMIPPQYAHFIYLNPVAGMIDFFRWTLGISDTFSPLFVWGFIATFVCLILSVVMFKRMEDDIIDTL